MDYANAQYAKSRSTEFDEQVGRRIRRQRILSGMTQTELGDAIGITYQQVCKYECGINRVAAKRLRDITVALQCSADDLLSGDDVDEAQSHPQHLDLCRQIYRLQAGGKEIDAVAAVLAAFVSEDGHAL